MSDTPKRGWLSFSIRDLLLVTVIVALAVGWLVDKIHYEMLLEEADTKSLIQRAPTGPPKPIE